MKNSFFFFLENLNIKKYEYERKLNVPRGTYRKMKFIYKEKQSNYFPGNNLNSKNKDINEKK